MKMDEKSQSTEEFSLNDHSESVLGVSYGMGVDSTAMLVGLVKSGIRPDFILFADVGCEREATYAYFPIIQNYLATHHFPPIQVVRYLPKYAPYSTLEDNMLYNATLPGATFGRGNCSIKFKIAPQEKWERRFKGRKIVKLVGFEAGEERRRLKGNQRTHVMKKANYEYGYPLINWGWDREKCKARIREAGLPVPLKSSCIFCPNMTPEELYELTPDERGRIVRIELAAEPFNDKIHGLWRQPRVKHNLPGSITEYLIEHNLEFTQPNEFPKIKLNPICRKARCGYSFHPPHKKVSLSAIAKVELEYEGHAAIINDMEQLELQLLT